MASPHSFAKGVPIMNIVHPICCGIDVHKSFLVATIIKTSNTLQPSYQKKRFSTFNNSILALKQWLLDNDCFDVCMESTGKYWIPVFHLLEDSIHVTIANPKWVKAVKGSKDDNKDSKWIAELFRLGMVPGSFIPSKEIRILREYTRYRFKVVSCIRSEKNRFQNAFTTCNVALDSVVSDMFGKSATAITDYLITTEQFDPEVCKSFLHRSLKKKADSVIASIEGYQMHAAQKERILLIRSHLDFLNDCLHTLDQKIEALIQPHKSAVAMLCTIPGVDRVSAITILSEIGTDMSQFRSSKRLCCWAGLTPSNNESAGKKKSVKISCAGVYLKPALVQCAHAAVKSKQSPYYKLKYERIAKRRGKKRAIIAIARMILTAVYEMLNNGEAWNPSDLHHSDLPVQLRNRKKEIAIRQAIQFLTLEGITVLTDSA